MEIKEDYVSFEVAKLLKEKNFDGESIMYFLPKDGANLHMAPTFIGYDDLVDTSIIICPTHQMVCAWVRRKGYSIEIHATAYGWIWNICKINGTDVCWSEDKGPNPGGAWDNYNECTESALKYTLTNLV